jgi:hypothetical protein
MPDEGMIVAEVSRGMIDDAGASISCTVDELRPEVYSQPVIVREEDHGAYLCRSII